MSDFLATSRDRLFGFPKTTVGACMVGAEYRYGFGSVPFTSAPAGQYAYGDKYYPTATFYHNVPGGRVIVPR